MLNLPEKEWQDAEMEDPEQDRDGANRKRQKADNVAAAHLDGIQTQMPYNSAPTRGVVADQQQHKILPVAADPSGLNGRKLTSADTPPPPPTRLVSFGPRHCAGATGSSKALPLARTARQRNGKKAIQTSWVENHPNAVRLRAISRCSLEEDRRGRGTPSQHAS